MRIFVVACLLLALPTMAVAQSEVMPQPPGGHRDPAEPTGARSGTAVPLHPNQPSVAQANGKKPDPFDTKADQPHRVGKPEAPVSQQ